MAVQDDCLYDGTVAKRPALADLSNGTKTNNPKHGKVPATHPCAEEDNQRAAVLAAHARVVDSAKVHVTFSGSVPGVAGAEGLRLSTDLDSFTLTDNGTGSTTVEWPENFFPAGVIPPYAVLVGDTAGAITTEFLTNGRSARVRTTDSTGTPADLPFVLVIA